MHTGADWQLDLLADLEENERTLRLKQDVVERRILVSAGNRAACPGRFTTEMLWSNQPEPTLFRAGS